MPRPEGATRLFFALWPDEAARMAFGRLAHALHAECGGRQVPERNIHLTLVFLGAVRAALVPAVENMAGATSGEAVDLAFDSVEYWRHNRIVWAGTTLCPPALRELCARLDAGANRLGLRTEARNFVPHVTLLRKAERAPAQRDPGTIAWHASEFVLVRSLPRPGGVAYEAISRWPLLPGDSGGTRSQPAA